MTNDLSTPGQRLSHLIDNVLKIKPKRFVLQIGINSTYLSQLRNNHKPFNTSLAYKITSAFPDVNGNWIFTGEGEPMKEPIQSHPSHAELPQLHEPDADYLPAGAITFDDVPRLFRALMAEIKDLRARVSELERQVKQ